MFAALARFSTYNFKLVVVLTAVFAGIAFHAFRGLPIEAYPDVTDPLVEVVAVFPGQSAEEVERQVGLELERVLAGTPHLTNIRTVSVFGLAVVTLRFDDASSARKRRRSGRSTATRSKAPALCASSARSRTGSSNGGCAVSRGSPRW